MNVQNLTSGKILVPLATMMVAGAVAVGSGATFTSESAHTASVTSGVLHHANSQNGQVLTIGNIKPGDTKTGTLTIKNDGSLDATLALKSVAATSGFKTGALLVKITDGATTVFNDDFSKLATPTTWDLGSLPVDATKTITYTVSMPTAADNDNQNKSASASFSYVTTQAGDNSSSSWKAPTAQ